MPKIGRPARALSTDALSQQSEQAIAVLRRLSATLKLQHRHFDDAVILHCISLIKDQALPLRTSLSEGVLSQPE